MRKNNIPGYIKHYKIIKNKKAQYINCLYIV